MSEDLEGRSEERVVRKVVLRKGTKAYESYRFNALFDNLIRQSFKNMFYHILGIAHKHEHIRM